MASVPVQNAGGSNCPSSIDVQVTEGNTFTMTNVVGERTVLDGRTRFRRCQCPLNDGICETSCPRTDVRNPTLETWPRAHLLEEGAPANYTLLTTPTSIDTRHAALGNPSAGPASFRLMGWEYWKDLEPGALPIPGTRKIIFRGVMWSWVSAFAPAGDPPQTQPNGDPNAALRQGITRLDVDEFQPAAVPCPPPKRLRYARDPWRRPSPFGDGNDFVFVDPIDPSPWLTAGRVAVGFPDRPDNQALDPWLASGIASDDFMFVPVSDPYASAKGTGAGVLVDKRGGVVSTLVHKASEQARMEAEHLPVSVAGTPSTPLVVAASGHRQEAAFFGDVFGGQVLPRMRVYDFATHTEFMKPVLSGQWYHPQAATYRVDDDAYYLLDRVGNDHYSLLRFGRDLRVVELGRWAQSGNFSSFGLTTSATGDLVVTSSSSSAHRICILRPVAPTPAQWEGGLLGVSRFVEGSGQMEQAAYLGMDGSLGLITYKQQATKLTGRRIQDGSPATVEDMAACF